MKIKHLATCVISILLILGICAGFCGSAAADPPLLPHAFFGNVTNTTGTAIPAGMVITAEVDGQTFSYTITDDGKIGESGTFGDKFQVTSSTNNTPITFKLGPHTASGSYTFVAGNVTNIDLKFPVLFIQCPINTTLSNVTNFVSPVTVVVDTSSILPSDLSLIITEESSGISSLPANFTAYKTYNISSSDSSIPMAASLTYSISSATLISSFRNNKDSVRFYHGVGSTWNEANIISAITSGSTTKVTFYAESFSPYLSGASTTVSVIPTSTPTAVPTTSPNPGQTIIQPSVEGQQNSGEDASGEDTSGEVTSELGKTPDTAQEDAVSSDDTATTEEEGIVDTSLSDFVAAIVGNSGDTTQATSGDSGNSENRGRGQSIILAAKELETSIHQALSSIGLGHVPVIAVVFPAVIIILALIVLGILAVIRRVIVVRNKKQKTNGAHDSTCENTQTSEKQESLLDKIRNKLKKKQV